MSAIGKDICIRMNENNVQKWCFMTKDKKKKKRIEINEFRNTFKCRSVDDLGIF